jgi:hypothetical protein
MAKPRFGGAYCTMLRCPPEARPLVPADLFGADLMRLGETEVGVEVEGGGFVVATTAGQGGAVKRVVLGFNELGM